MPSHRLQRWLPPLLTFLFILTLGIGYAYWRTTTPLRAYRIKNDQSFPFFVVCFSWAVLQFLLCIFSDPGVWTTQRAAKDRKRAKRRTDADAASNASFAAAAVTHADPLYVKQLQRTAQMKIPTHPFESEQPKPASSSSSSSPLSPSIVASSSDIVHFPALEVKANGSRRFCRTCYAFKPDRCHHCSLCSHCVLRQDHHCAFLGVCIGARNLKFFLSFLLFTSLASFYIAWHSCVTDPVAIIEQREFKTAILVLALLIVASASGCATFIFFVLHLYLIVINSTTIETMQKSATPFRVKSPFRLSWMQNLSMALGPIWSWLLPFYLPLSCFPPPSVSSLSATESSNSVATKAKPDPSSLGLYQEMCRNGIAFPTNLSAHPQEGLFGLHAPFDPNFHVFQNGNDEANKVIDGEHKQPSTLTHRRIAK